MFSDVNVVVCDFVHYVKSVCLSAGFQGLYVEVLFYVGCDTWCSCVVVCNEPCSPGVYLYKFVYVGLCVGLKLQHSTQVLGGERANKDEN